MNGSELDGRFIMVREDREDRDAQRGRGKGPSAPVESSGLQVKPYTDTAQPTKLCSHMQRKLQALQFEKLSSVSSVHSSCCQWSGTEPGLVPKIVSGSVHTLCTC